MEFAPELLKYLRAAERVAVLTGAGVSAESGVPTFRDAQSGLWAQYNPQDLATPEAYRRNPRLVWEWYAWRKEKIRQIQPNPGHYALAQMEKRIPNFTLITQNIDGLHQAAGSGCSGGRVLELHGNISRVKCYDEDRLVDRWEATGEIPPRCPRCGGLLRPDVVWFGEMLPQENLEKSVQAAENCHIFFSIGTSGVVEPAASLPFWALKKGAVVVEINLEETPLSAAATYFIEGQSGKILPELVKAAW